ncbi:hypothetical protein [Pelagibius marinus]|uniref:hypothetical protein n=1 Tax=Pelagibius marinus TaxID=2762760 RepID=UPI00187306E6|nr:hypothetical protein [Pelagibius marinus]
MNTTATRRLNRPSSRGLLCLPVVLAAVWLLATALPAAAQAPGGALRLTLDIGKPQVVVGEPVYATLTLTNTSKQSQPVFPDLYPEVGVGAVAISYQGRSALFVPIGVDDVETQVSELAPGQSISATFAIFYGAGGWTFPAPGSYQLTGHYRHPSLGEDRELRSEPVTLNVAAGGPAGDLLTEDSKAGDEAGLFMLWEGGDHLRRGIAHLETLIERYPEQIQADYARLALGLSLSRGFRDYSIGKVRPPDYQRSRALLSRLGRAPLQPFSALQLQLALARIGLALNDTPQAQASADRASAIVQDRPAFADRLDLAVEVEPRLGPLLKR